MLCRMETALPHTSPSRSALSTVLLSLRSFGLTELVNCCPCITCLPGYNVAMQSCKASATTSISSLLAW